MNRFYKACYLFSLIISLKKTQVMYHGTAIPPAISVKDHQLEVVNQFTYLGSTTTNNFLEVELDKRIGKAATVFSRLSKKVWENRQLTAYTKVAVYKACVTGTLVYGSESWALYAAQERKLNVFHLRCLRRVLGVSWQDKVTNNEVLDRVGIHLCIPYSANLYIGWRMDAFQRTCCVVSWSQGTETNVVINFVTQTSASVTWRPENGLHQLGIPGRQQLGLETRTVVKPQTRGIVLKETSEEKRQENSSVDSMKNRVKEE